MRIAEFSARWEGRTIDGVFPLRQFLGGGESSAVFLTTYEGRGAAIKLLAADLENVDARFARLRESHKLSHINLIRIFTIGRCEVDEIPLIYIVMELAEEDLSQVLPDRSLTAVEARDMLEPALHALGYLHAQGFVHAHLKPSNIMAVSDRLKVSSDGMLPAAARQSGSGTPYDPPEKVMSPAGDVWSLGITLVEVLTQLRPASGTVPADLPEPFAEIVRGCLRRKPAERWTVGQISSLLAPSASPVVVRGRRAAPAGVWILLALVAITVAGVIFMHSEAGSPTSATPVEAVMTPTPEPAPQPKQVAKVLRHPETVKQSSSTVPVSGIEEQPLPEITDQARSTIHGKVRFTVQVDVSPSGSVTGVKLEPPGASRYFGERTLAAVRRWKFEPVSVKGSQVGQRWRVGFEFVRNGTKVQPQRVSP